MNSHIASTSLLGLDSIHKNNYEEIDERLLNTFISEPKSTFSEDEESSDSSNKAPSIVNVRKANKQCPVSSRKKSMKKDDIDLESNEIVTKSKKSSKNSKRSTDASNQESAEKKSLYKTELCRNWEETNHCRYGMKCQYAHGAADLREIDRHPKYKTQKCRTFHQTGSCPYGARCTFRHFNLPGDALEMKNLDKEEEKEKEQQHVKREDSIFSAENQKLMQQNWFLDNSNGLGDLHKHLMMNQPSSFDPEDSLLPSNAESLLPHQLLFDLESPDEDVDQPRRCPLRNYVNLPSFSNFQAPHYLPSNYHQAHQQQQDSNCKTFFRPWLF